MFSKDPTLQSLKVTPVLLLVWLPLFFVHTESVESMDGPFTGEYKYVQYCEETGSSSVMEEERCIRLI